MSEEISNDYFVLWDGILTCCLKASGIAGGRASSPGSPEMKYCPHYFYQDILLATRCELVINDAWF